MVGRDAGMIPNVGGLQVHTGAMSVFTLQNGTKGAQG
jgi:hypothetical protein